MKIANKVVDEGLFYQYVEAISTMEQVRVSERGVKYYGSCDRKRRAVHNRLLESVGVTRGNKEFELCLALEVDRVREEFMRHVGSLKF